MDVTIQHHRHCLIPSIFREYVPIPNGMIAIFTSIPATEGYNHGNQRIVINQGNLPKSKNKNNAYLCSYMEKISPVHRLKWAFMDYGPER